jgi:hypothetical protein
MVNCSLYINTGGIMKKKISILILSLLVSNRVFATSEIDLVEQRKQWLSIATDIEFFPCAIVTPSKKDCDPAENISPAGDMVLFNSLLCYSGYQKSCEAIKNSMEASGRWRRSPLHVNKPVVEGSGSFSKDQTLGLLLYFVVTNDSSGAKKWFNWVKKFSSRSFPRVLKVCEKNHCTISPTLFSLMYKVWKKLGLSPSTNMKLFKGQTDESILIAQTKNIKPGYELHLKAVTSVLLNFLGRDLNRLNQTIYNKQKENPFYQYLIKKDFSKIKIDLLDKCKVITSPDYINNRGHQWAWERDTKGKSWENSMSWDCIFMANLIIDGIYKLVH